MCLSFTVLSGKFCKLFWNSYFIRCSEGEMWCHFQAFTWSHWLFASNFLWLRGTGEIQNSIWQLEVAKISPFLPPALSSLWDLSFWIKMMPSHMCVSCIPGCPRDPLSWVHCCCPAQEGTLSIAVSELISSEGRLIRKPIRWSWLALNFFQGEGDAFAHLSKRPESMACPLGFL